MYEVWEGLGVMSFGGRVSVSCGKVFSGPAGVRPNAFGGHNNCLQQSGCGSKLLPWKSWLDYLEGLNADSKADSHWAIRDCFPQCETYQLDLMNSW